MINSLKLIIEIVLYVEIIIIDSRIPDISLFS